MRSRLLLGLLAWLLVASCLAACHSTYGGTTGDPVADRKIHAVYDQLDAERSSAWHRHDRDLKEQSAARCDATTTRLRGCAIIDDAFARTARFNCLLAMEQTWSPSYARIHCFEQALDCAGIRWCQRQ